MLALDSYAIVGHGEKPIAIYPFGRDVNARLGDAPVLDPIAEEVLKHLHQLRWIAADNGQFIGGNLCPVLEDQRFQVIKRLLQHRLKINGYKWFWPRIKARIGQQVVNARLKSMRPFRHAANPIFTLGVKSFAVVYLQQLHKTVPL